MRNEPAPDKRLLAALAVVLIGLMAGCVSSTWRPNWWNFYERGLSRTSEGKLDEAAADFETAIGARAGATVARPKDARRVRTYGMHFIDDYFPHRELGVGYYRMKRYADAERELQISLSQTPSAKAKMYLNLSRRELLRQKPAQDAPPALTVESPEGAYVNARDIQLKGMAESKNGIASILINGRRLFVELAEQTIRFSEELHLKPGVNEVVVEAADLLGKSTLKELHLTVDVQYPALAIEDAVRKDADTAALSGLATDNLGIVELVIEGRQQAVPRPSTEISFSLDLPLGEAVAVRVTDVAGNTASAQLRITEDMLRPAEEGASGPIRLAMLGTDSIADWGNILLAQNLTATSGDRTPPILSLLNITDGRVIYDDQIILDGMARDNGRLAALSVNREDLLGTKTGVLVRYFTYRADLSVGENRFTVVAVDKAGNKTEKSFSVVRKVQQPLQTAARLTMALLPLQENGSDQTATPQIYDLLLGGFFECGRFNLVERDETAFRALLTELKIGNSELADRETAIRIGRIRTAEGMLYGKTIEDARSITVDLWMVDTETSEILFFADVYGENKSRDELKWLVDGLVLKVKQHFPLVRGKVTRVTDEGVFIDNGMKDGIWTGMKYLILKQDREGDSGGLRTLTEARVQTVQPESCFAVLSDENNRSLVQTNDPVITK
jgi:tetratricopeptide (TPR) repeat protein